MTAILHFILFLLKFRVGKKRHLPTLQAILHFISFLLNRSAWAKTAFAHPTGIVSHFTVSLSAKEGTGLNFIGLALGQQYKNDVDDRNQLNEFWCQPHDKHYPQYIDQIGANQVEQRLFWL